MTTRPIKAGHRARPPLPPTRSRTAPALLAPQLTSLCAELIRRLPALQRLDARRILIVAGQARGGARASIRSLDPPDQALTVRVDGRRALFELTLRPLWFRQSTPLRRLESLLHELWHIDPEQPDRLAAARQHQTIQRRQVRTAVDRLLADARALIDPAAFACLAHDGVALLPAWLTRPVLTGEPQRRHRYDERDLYLQAIEMITPAGPSNKLTLRPGRRTVEP